MIKWKKTLRSSTIMLIAGLVCCLPLALQAEEAAGPKAADNKGAPKIVFDSIEHDFGQVNQNSAQKHTFTFKNEGQALLVIEKVKAG